jgi:predicted RNase H-like nuclease
MARWVAGLDGCRGAWAGALIDLDDPARHRCALFADLGALLDAPERPRIVGIDVPIGLPDRILGGGRAADRAARARLGPARSSVFPMPPRAAIYAPDYPAAKAASRAASDPPFAPSIQGYNIFRYVRAVDTLLRARSDARARVHEVHPEVAFHALNGGRPLGLPKKGPRAREGLDLRRALLSAAGLPAALIDGRVKGVPEDDHLDALAALVVAGDILLGCAVPLPETPEHDAHGLPVVIWAPAPRAGMARHADRSCGAG